MKILIKGCNLHKILYIMIYMSLSSTTFIALRKTSLFANKKVKQNHNGTSWKMKLPNSESAIIPREKIAHYLLDLKHPSGRGKAIFFRNYGFKSEDWHIFEDALRTHIQLSIVTDFLKTNYGDKYILEGDILTPDGNVLHIRSIWIMPFESSAPILVTAYPLGFKT